ncbi:MAG: phosphatase [Oscillospiraceae bacterium]|nr:phosphatase [Oscillospiraceae bacterium]
MKQAKQPIIVLPNMRSFLEPDGRRAIIRQYRHSLLFFGYLLLLAEFILLEKYIVPQYWISCPLDQLIPFIPVFVVPYMIWFPLIAVVLILLCFSDRGDFIRTIMLVYLGMAAAMIIYLIFPHGQSLRPIITGNDYFSRMVRFNIYANDTNTNCCPSIHVLNQLAIHIGLCKSKLFRNRRGWKMASLVATIVICFSTVFIKQHSIIDIAAALLLEIALYLFVFKLDWSNLFSQGLKSKLKQREIREN